ncbi:hypothetical protein [Paenibacillus pedocola]|uniref:hypothetical protein n=1 Tax=Paenibacillus pedocola TaxID=3242193 RepID=UPI002877FF68|nr:hypothetical protein [Paenibacillus typhae]
MPDEPKTSYYVSVNHGIIRDVPGDSNEFEVLLSKDELTVLQDLLQNLRQEDNYAFRRAAVPYKSADHDDAAEQFDDGTIRLYRYLHRVGSAQTQQTIEQLGVLSKLENTGYEDKGYGDGSPTNK